MTALDQLLDLSTAPDPIRHDLGREELEALQVRAAEERLQEQRPLVPALDRRCKETGVEQVGSRADLVPLMFSHSTYKSYPASFVAKGQWARLSLWLETVTTAHVSDVDVSGATDVDGWMECLKAAGLHLVATSGTSGKHSFLLMDEGDVTRSQAVAVSLLGFPYEVPKQNDRPITLLVPGNAPMRYGYAFRGYAAAVARPGAAHTLTDEPMRLSDSARAAAVRKAMADGSITPAELEQVRADDVERQRATDANIRRIADVVLGYRDEPQIVLGPYATWWRMMEIAHEQGVPDGSFHPGTIASITGGLKGMTLPDDYEAQLARFLGDVKRIKLYGMSELSTTAPLCEAGLYHVPPWMTLLVVDETGEQLLDVGDDGWVTGRVAFYDPVWHGRWGGIVSGDQATANYWHTCSCGRTGTVIQDSIQRYSELSAGGDDKLTCGGTIEQYIRGVVGAS
jgi:hypothetical protein